MKRDHLTIDLVIAASAVIVLAAIVFLQFNTPTLYGVDGYYHIKIPYFIRSLGFRYDFPWTQFSTFKKCFSDKDFLLHLIILPFTYIKAGILTQAKLATIFVAFLFIITFIAVQKKYVLKPLLAIATIALLFSINFLSYINYLRPKTLAIMLVLLLLYFLIEKKWLIVFLLCLIYPLAHLSFPVVVILSLGVETMRYLYKREFYPRNFVYSILGIVLAQFIHPNFPNNGLSLYLNGFLVPWSTMFGKIRLNYGLEWNPITTKIALLDFPILFAGTFAVVILLFLGKAKVSFHTLAFFFATALFAGAAMFSNCYWYFVYPLGLIFLAMFFTDFLRDKGPRARIMVYLAAGFILALTALNGLRTNSISDNFSKHIGRNMHFERMAKWMNTHLPPEQVVFHTGWSDSPYFICFNDKDYYLNVLDPIYLYYYSNNVYYIYDALVHGRAKKPFKIFKKVFKTRYGYCGKGYGLYKLIKDNPDRIKILFEDDYGVIFEILDKKTV